MVGHPVLVGVASASLVATMTMLPVSASVSPSTNTAPATVAPAAAPAEAAPSSPRWLFVVSGARGTVTGIGRDTGKERMTLTLAGVSDHATQFADRPIRDAYVLSTRDLVARWHRWFVSNPPNAVLTFNLPGDPTPHSIVMTLRNPRYDRQEHTLRFSARHIHRQPDTSPDAVQQITVPKRRPPARFLRGSLFIDSADDGCPYAGGPLICPGANLFGAWFAGEDLSGSVLTGSNLGSATLTRTNLTGAELSDANLSLADLTGATLHAAHLDRAEGQDANFTDADMTGASLADGNFMAGNLANANLTGASLTGIDLMGATLTGANLTRANLANANMMGANLAGADLTGADVTSTVFFGANLSSARWVDGRVCGSDPSDGPPWTGQCL